MRACATSLVPRPEEEEENWPGFSLLRIRLPNYLGYHHVLICGKVLSLKTRFSMPKQSNKPGRVQEADMEIYSFVVVFFVN